MKKKPSSDPADPLGCDDYWEILGLEAGLRNQPRTASGDAAPRSLLRNAHESTLRDMHLGIRDELKKLAEEWHNVRRWLHVAHHQPADPRAMSNVTMLQEKQVILSERWDAACEDYLIAVRGVTNRARSCDGVWRAANLRNRDRQITIEPTDLEPPNDVLDLPDKPY